ncbi:folate family ECF transporter S component [Natranaerobius trueperi]|uniref:ECF transporter S component n=1 Tax=Natranaerobius trueperi TaxID=759412 RepID=A0A226BY56_9FIRM|nr:folate family ECF transporter S component [Natranaerobius trueperi]OWZ83702.1 ECF transporter S component [Natranaerobius trueperi]
MKKLLSSPHALATMALLAAINIILSFVTSGFTISFGGIAGIKIGLGGLPVIIAGILLGPLAGGVVGVVSDLVGYLVMPMGPYMPHFTLTAALTGIIPVLVIRMISKNTDVPNFFQLTVGIGLGQIITTVLLVSFFLYSLFGLPLWYTMAGNAISQLISIPIYSYLTLIVLKPATIRTLAKEAVQN